LDLIEIHRLAVKMRDGIESIPLSERPIGLEAFPLGACSDASLLLGAYLKDCGHGEFTLISAERGCFEDNSWTSHAWLMWGRLIVDITADQFEDAPKHLIVMPQSIWHKTFKEGLINLHQ
jgi:hypothetical protein